MSFEDRESTESYLFTHTHSRMHRRAHTRTRLLVYILISRIVCIVTRRSKRLHLQSKMKKTLLISWVVYIDYHTHTQIEHTAYANTLL